MEQIWTSKNITDNKTELNNNSNNNTNIQLVNNNIYFYSEVYRKEALDFITKLQTMDDKHIASHIVNKSTVPDTINLHINSYGGSIFAGLGAMDTILSTQSPTTSIIEGVCASAATFMSVVADNRIIRPNAYMLIHQLGSSFWGKYSEFQDEQKNLDMFMDHIKAIYKKYTAVPSKKLDEILSHDLFFNAGQCLDYGLVDNIIK